MTWQHELISEATVLTRLRWNKKGLFLWLYKVPYNWIIESHKNTVHNWHIGMLYIYIYIYKHNIDIRFICIRQLQDLHQQYIVLSLYLFKSMSIYISPGSENFVLVWNSWFGYIVIFMNIITCWTWNAVVFKMASVDVRDAQVDRQTVIWR